MGRHRSAEPEGYEPYGAPPPRRRRGRGAAYAAFAAALVVLLGMAAVGWVMFRDEVTCLAGDAELRVAAAPELVEPLEALAADFAAQQECSTVEIVGAESSDVAYGITGAGQTSGDVEAEVWIPDSTLWADHVHDASDTRLEVTGSSVAKTPLILASAEAPEDETSWQSLVPEVPPRPDDPDAARVHVVQPTVDSSGLATLALIYGSIEGLLAEDAEAGADAGRSPEFIAALQALQQSVAPSTEEALAAVQQSEGRALLAMSEQEAWSHNAQSPDQAVHVSYPTEGTYTLDYPFLVRESGAMSMADDFRNFLDRPASQDVMREHGFRGEDGTLDPAIFDPDQGFAEEEPPGLPVPEVDAVNQLSSAWNQLSIGTRLLTIYDVSGSMLAEVPGTGATRMQIVLAAAGEGLQLFADDAQLGVWEFSTDLEPGVHHREVAPLEELGAEVDGATHREGIAQDLAAMQPNPQGDTALYETILAAHRHMQETYAPDRNNVVSLMTDGEQDNPEGDLGLEELLSTLAEEQDPERPVPFVIINFGEDLDTGPMEEVAELTGGQSFQTADPEEIGEIMLRGFALRLGQGDPSGEPTS